MTTTWSRVLLLPFAVLYKVRLRKSEAQRLTGITCKRKSILCHEAIVALIVRLSAHDEVPCGWPMPAPYLIRGRGINHPRYGF